MAFDGIRRVYNDFIFREWDMNEEQRRIATEQRRIEESISTYPRGAPPSDAAVMRSVASGIYPELGHRHHGFSPPFDATYLDYEEAEPRALAYTYGTSTTPVSAEQRMAREYADYVSRGRRLAEINYQDLSEERLKHYRHLFETETSTFHSTEPTMTTTTTTDTLPLTLEQGPPPLTKVPKEEPKEERIQEPGPALVEVPPEQKLAPTLAPFDFFKAMYFVGMSEAYVEKHINPEMGAGSKPHLEVVSGVPGPITGVVFPRSSEFEMDVLSYRREIEAAFVTLVTNALAGSGTGLRGLIMGKTGPIGTDMLTGGERSRLKERIYMRWKDTSVESFELHPDFENFTGLPETIGRLRVVVTAEIRPENECVGQHRSQGEFHFEVFYLKRFVNDRAHNLLRHTPVSFLKEHSNYGIHPIIEQELLRVMEVDCSSEEYVPDHQNPHIGKPVSLYKELEYVIRVPTVTDVEGEDPVELRSRVSRHLPDGDFNMFGILPTWGSMESGRYLGVLRGLSTLRNSANLSVGGLGLFGMPQLTSPEVFQGMDPVKKLLVLIEHRLLDPRASSTVPMVVSSSAGVCYSTLDYLLSNSIASLEESMRGEEGYAVRVQNQVWTSCKVHGLNYRKVLGEVFTSAKHRVLEALEKSNDYTFLENLGLNPEHLPKDGAPPEVQQGGETPVETGGEVVTPLST